MWVILVMAVLLTTACRKAENPPPEPGLYEQIHQRLKDLQNFRAKATVEYISNRGSNVYETIQHSRISGEYRVEVTGPEHVAGNVTSFDGSQIYQFNKRISGRVTLLPRETKERSEIFLTAFIRNYLDNLETTSASTATIEGNPFIILEVNIPGEHPYIAMQRLFICSAKLLPQQLIIFGADGTQRVIVTYHDFEYNVALEDALFTI
jgi:outer membrane lipoprotein-sorting protein